jgi:transcriptional regulator with XRE-family HTH domain
LSQKALAEQSGVPRPTIAHLESGQANPTLGVVLKVAASLGVTVDGLVDPGEAPIVILSPRTLPTERTSRIRRVKLLTGAPLRDPEIERVVVKAGGRIHLEATSSAPAVVVCERGDFSVISGPLEEALAPERVAYVRSAADCFSPLGGVLYLIQGR